MANGADVLDLAMERRIHPPCRDIDALGAAVSSNYGLHGRLNTLDTELGDTYEITTDDTHAILKLARGEAGRRALAFRAAVRQQVGTHVSDVEVQPGIRTVRGDEIATLDDGESAHTGEPLYGEMLRFIDGSTLASLPLSNETVEEYGRRVSDVDVALRDLHHRNENLPVIWDLLTIPDATARLLEGIGPERRYMARMVLERFTGEILPGVKHGRLQAIHGDLSPNNILATIDGRVTGIIDFGDATRSYPILEVAVATAGLLRRDWRNGAANVTSFLRGYQGREFSDIGAIRLLLGAVAARMALRACMVAWSVQRGDSLAEGQVRYVERKKDTVWTDLAAALELDPSTIGEALGVAKASATPSRRFTPDALATRASARWFDRARSDELSGVLHREVQKYYSVFNGSYRLFYEKPIDIAYGIGAHLYSADGTEYLDAYNNVPVVGHSNAHVADAVSAQMRLVNTNTRYLQASVIDYADRLLQLFPEMDARVLFACSGSEANDVALRLAVEATGGQGVVVMDGAYHGNTSLVASISPSLAGANGLGENVCVIAPPDPRIRTGMKLAERLALDLEDAVWELQRRGFGFGVLIFDSLFASSGVFTDPAPFLGPLVDRAHELGGVVIADEIQAGFHRTGRHWWGYQRHNISPDIVTLGKPIANGLPLSAVVHSARFNRISPTGGRFFSTFGGSTVSVAAAGAVIDILEQPEYVKQVESVGQKLRRELAQVFAGAHNDCEVRGAGLFLGVEIGGGLIPREGDVVMARRVINELLQRRVLISATGTHGNVLKIRPPLCFTEKDAMALVQRCADAVDALQASRSGDGSRKR